MNLTELKAQAREKILEKCVARCPVCEVYALLTEEAIDHALEVFEEVVRLEKQPERRGTYGKYDLMHIQNNIGFNEARTEIASRLAKFKEKI